MTKESILQSAIEKVVKRCSYCKNETGTNQYKCNPCNAKKAMEYYRKNPEKYRIRRKQWKAKNPEKDRLMNAKYRMKLKVEVLNKYGGIKCTCCGETEIKFLGIDHMDNDGNLERKITGGGHAFYRWLKTNNFPEKNYRVMCQNCNSARYYYGECPHKNKQMVLESDPLEYLSKFL